MTSAFRFFFTMIFLSIVVFVVFKKYGTQIGTAIGNALSSVGKAAAAATVNGVKSVAKAPSAVADAITEAATGEPSFGGYLASKFNADTIMADACAAGTGPCPYNGKDAPPLNVAEKGSTSPEDILRANLEARSIATLEIGEQPYYTDSVSPPVTGEGGAAFGMYPQIKRRVVTP